MYRLYVENQAKWTEICEKDYKLPRQATVQRLQDGILLPIRREKVPGLIDYATVGGVCNSAFEFVAGWTRREKPRMNKSCIEGYRVEEKELEYRDETVVFGGVIDGHFGHFFSEGLSRFWWMVQNPEAYDKIVIALTTERKSWFGELYRLMGIPEEKVEYVERPTKFREIIIPDETMYLWGGYREELNLVYDAIVSRLPKSDYDKVYLTRTQFERQDCIGEEYFEEYFRKKGYHVVAPEQLPLEEQLSLVANAKEVACVCGTLSHFALFSAPGTKYTILNRAMDHYFIPQVIINQLRDIHAYYIDATRNYLPVKHNRGCFLLEPNGHWNDYIADQGEVPVELTEEQRAHNAYRFLGKWRETYLQKRAMVMLQDTDVCDLLDSMDKAMGGHGVERKQYGFTMRRSRMEKELKQLRECEEVVKLSGDALDKEKAALLKELTELKKKNATLSSELAKMKTSWKRKLKYQMIHLFGKK